jgi:chemotaxis family two-component system response regulator PixG
MILGILDLHLKQKGKLQQMTGVDSDSQQMSIGVEELLAQLQHLKTIVFSGSLVVETSKSLSWSFFWRLGRLSWPAGGTNAEERWQRNLASCCSGLTDAQLAQMGSGEGLQRQYSTIVQLLGRGLVQRQQLGSLMLNAIAEILFDIIQHCETSGDRLSYQTIADDPTSKLGALLPMVEVEQAFPKAIQAWQTWQEAGLTSYSPNLFPFIQQPDILKAKTSPSTYQGIVSLVDGSRTLRGIAHKSNQDLTALTKFLIPLVKLGAIAFSDVPSASKCDLPVINNATPSPKQPLIACVDDSPVVCQTLEKILKQHNYRFLGIQDSLKAIPMLLKSKPDFIFLDLLMPVTNGYEVCAQLRKTPSFKDVPIVILTGRDGLVDRMRAKMVGSTDFLSKPVEVEQLLKMIDKYLSIGAPT